jgi:hypothetical protein
VEQLALEDFSLIYYLIIFRKFADKISVSLKSNKNTWWYRKYSGLVPPSIQQLW